jgi:hypothetical protein
MRRKPVERERYPQNAEGDFYVEKDLCMMCMMPEVEAPELMGFDNEAWNCYFKRQPATSEELTHAIAAVASSEIQGLRYAGSDPNVLRRLRDAGASECCDAFASADNTGKDASLIAACFQRIRKLVDR